MGTGIQINSLGLGKRLSETGVLGISVTNMRFGEIPITETELPEGGIGNLDKYKGEEVDKVKEIQKKQNLSNFFFLRGSGWHQPILPKTGPCFIASHPTPPGQN